MARLERKPEAADDRCVFSCGKRTRRRDPRRIPFAADAAGRTLSDEHTKHVLVFALADARRRFARNARAISSGGTVPE